MSGLPNVPPYQQFAAHYDEFIGEESFRQRRETFEWIVQRYGLSFRSAVDVGCGTGTFVQYLLRVGVNPVWGVDLSPAMLAQAVKKNRLNSAWLVQQDLRELRLPEAVDLLTCQFETLNYLLTDSDLRIAFAGFADALKPGGFAVFDVATRRPDEPSSPSRFEHSEIVGETVTIQARYDTERLVQVAQLRVSGSATSQSETHVQRVHPLDDVVAALDSSELTLIAMHDGSDVHQPVELAENVIFLARRARRRRGRTTAR